MIRTIWLMTFNPPSADRIFALIPCAGKGNRAGSSLPKQYQLIGDLPLVVHTLRAFASIPRLTHGLLVVAPDDQRMQGLLTDHPQPLFSLAHVGGASRAASVLAGLHALVQHGASSRDWVLVHDAARCLVTPTQINLLIDACQADAVGGILALPLADTLKQETAGRVSATINRESKWLAQTPQMFRLGALTAALSNGNEAVTDEASAMEAMGFAPLLIAGSSHNFKVTYPEDFVLAQAVLKLRAES